MFCSACGIAIAPGQNICPQCGRPVLPVVPAPVPGIQFEVEKFRSNIEALSVVWFVYAGVTLLFGFAKLTFAKAFFSGGFGPWMHGSMPPWFFPMALQFAWIGIIVRAALAVVAGWALMEHQEWGRIVAIVIAILSLIHPLLGTALGIWTLVMLLGYRNSTLYEQL